MKLNLDQLRERIEAAPRNVRGRRKFGADLRGDVVAAAERAGTTGAEFCESIGIDVGVLAKWKQSAKKRQKRQHRRPKMKQPTFLPVAVVEPTPVRTFTVRGASGVEVAGLDLTDVASLLRVMSGGNAC